MTLAEWFGHAAQMSFAAGPASFELPFEQLRPSELVTYPHGRPVEPNLEPVAQAFENRNLKLLPPRRAANLGSA